ncbi:MAG: helix-turn-helix domain-containing protein [Actinomycetota bacterium]|nr:helix-turn-helix domain-containing protein [Actinomycetota bacterium]
MPERPSDPWLTSPEVASRLRQPESTIRHWRSTGTGPASVKFGRRVVYRTSEVERFEHDQEQAAERSR